MNSFHIKDDFYINDKKIKIISGAIHYFRVVPEYWKDRLEKLKLIGCNCVETYIPWNIHEPEKGKFDFKGINNFSEFVKIAPSLDLYVILRPSPYICAEWDFGGLPYWLLKDDSMIIRSTYHKFLEAVDEYYSELFKYIVPLQITNGGPVIMLQLENEYGSFGNDKRYLKAIKDLMIKHGTTVPLFTSDGSWQEALDAGVLFDENILPTANFGSKVIEQTNNLKKFMDDNNIDGPLMCMEFWIGWFSAWGKEIKKRDTKEVSKEFKDILDLGHVNIYMFHGGTNFGFYNGANFYDSMVPQITSYDYDALLTEWGMPTEKYYAFKNVISNFKSIPDFELSTKVDFIHYGDIKLTNKVSLFSTLESLCNPIYNDIPLNMEKLNQGYGYILYTSDIGKKRYISRSKLVDCDDRASIYLNHELIATQDAGNIGENIALTLNKDDKNEIAILVENLGRVNYGDKLRSPLQKKGLKGGFMVDLHFHNGWNHYCLDLKNIDRVDFSLPYEENTPAFYEYTFNIDTKGDTFLHLKDFGKGCAFINGFNLGRFFDIGPTNYLYIPSPLLKESENKIVIFETEGKYSDVITLSDKPLFK